MEERQAEKARLAFWGAEKGACWTWRAEGVTVWESVGGLGGCHVTQGLWALPEIWIFKERWGVAEGY